jgi:ribonuclease Y
MSPFIITLLSGAVGIAIGYIARKTIAQNNANSVEATAEKRIAEAKAQEKEIILEAKDKAIKLIDEAKQEANDRREEIKKMQERLEQRENMFDKTLTEFEARKEKLQTAVEQIDAMKKRVEEQHEAATAKLQEVANMSREDALTELLNRVAEAEQDALMSRKIKMDHETAETLKEKAQAIMITAMERTASNHASETTSTAVDLPSDEMKGRIIGKEGRNIKTLEKLTGCELIIDETPDQILISGFSPIRRRVAHLALNRLIKDGRIQPAKIEEAVEESKKELALDIKKAGEEALHKLGIVGIDPKLVSIVGRLKYRTSYGQHILNHSIEVAQLCAIMAAELGMDVAKAKKAGFFHDIGKAVDQDTQGTHTEIGHTILTKFGIDPEIAEVALTHHDPNPPLLLTKIVMAADAISASRTGARRDTFEQYVARLEELEAVAKDFPGVDKVYAIQAGREVRVFVQPGDVDEYQSYNLAKDIARKIESQLQYPGEIRVNVIRETRAIEYAR